MSLKTWKAEFYPVTAEAAMKGVPPESAAEVAVQHSLKKWVGLRPEHLKKHECRLVSGTVEDANLDALFINGDSCALCVRYQPAKGSGSPACTDCPILAVRGGRCDENLHDDDASPYHQLVRSANPEPMIELLELCLARVKGEPDAGQAEKAV